MLCVKDKSKNVVIFLLILIILILGILVFLFATGTLTFNSQANSSDSLEGNTYNGEENLVEQKLTTEEAISILKSDYNDAVRHILNETVSYCGEYATGDNTSLTLNGFLYEKSSIYHSFEELDNDLKNYVTEELLKSLDSYNKEVDDGNGNTIGSYYEKNGNLYCNTWNKGGNLNLEYYNEEESIFEILSIEENLFNAKINAVYYDTTKTTKTIKNIEVSVIKNGDKWLVNSYQENV